jgi:hypothetical protein
VDEALTTKFLLANGDALLLNRRACCMPLKKTLLEEAEDEEEEREKRQLSSSGLCAVSMPLAIAIASIGTPTLSTLSDSAHKQQRKRKTRAMAEE